MFRSKQGYPTKPIWHAYTSSLQIACRQIRHLLVGLGSNKTNIRLSILPAFP